MKKTIKKEKVLVTGGAGFIGSHTAQELCRMGFEVTVFDNLSTGNRSNLSKEVSFIKGDIRKKEDVDSAMKNIDYVIHLAAIASVSISIEKPLLTHDVNVTGTLNVFQSAIEHSVKKVIYASSAAVYGNIKTGKVREDSILLPESPYGLHKLINEQYARQFGQRSKTTFTGLRYFNVYGPRQSLLGGYPAVIPNFCKLILSKQKINLFGDGSQSRDFVYVKDVARINALLLKVKSKVSAFNVGTGKSTTIRQIISIIENHSKSKAKIIMKPFRPGDIKKSQADISSLNKVIKHNFVPLEEGLAQTIEYYKNFKN